MTPGPQHQVGVLRLSQKLDLIPATFSLLATLVKGLITGIFRERSGTRTYRHHVVSAVAKKLLSRFSSLQLQYINPTFDQIYLDFCKSNGFVPQFVSTHSGVSGFWLGDKSATYVIINFHGGGFATDAIPSHLRVWFDIQKHLHKNDRNTAFFYPTYTLTPHATYPTQLIQAVEALRYVLEDECRKPEEVILAGDSAGANLCVAILSHLMHPSDDVKPLSISGPLKGMVLVSPWLSFDTTYPSMARNYDRDIDPPKKLEIMAKDYLLGRKSDNYTEAVGAPIDWWEHSPLEGTLVVAGADEVFVDSQQEWVDKFKIAGNKIDTVFAQDECHIAPFIWAEFGDTHETIQGAKIKSWLKENLSTDTGL